MASLYATVAVYDEAADAEQDWVDLEAAAEMKRIEIADAAFLVNREGETVVLQRQSHHGWGKGAVVGAVVGILFPPSLLGAAAVGAGGGALVASLNRSLGRSKIMELGEALDRGALAIVVVAPADAAEAVSATLQKAKTVQTAPSASTEEIQRLLAQ
jgi:uncharacterized membrane protein